MALLYSETMALDTALISFRLSSTQNEEYTVDEQSLRKRNKQLALIIFTCNHCPYAIASWPILRDLHQNYAEQGLEVIAVNPNNNPKYPADSLDNMAKLVDKEGLGFPYLFDETQEIARRYKAVCTPDPFLFYAPDPHSSFTLYYHGRLNDNWQDPKAVTESSMELYIQAALGQAAKPTQSYPSMGCSIKWNTE